MSKNHQVFEVLKFIYEAIITIQHRARALTMQKKMKIKNMNEIISN